MAAERVTHVVFLSTNAFEPAVFMRAAENQRYRPIYGLTSQQYPDALRALVDSAQLRGAAVIGWLPPLDVAEGQDPRLPPTRQCIDVLKANGKTFASRTDEGLATYVCDTTAVFTAVAARPGGIGGQATFAAIAAHGEYPFAPASTFASRLEAGRPDGVRTWRLAAYDGACACFVYGSRTGSF
jgi:hypothetical protein